MRRTFLPVRSALSASTLQLRFVTPSGWDTIPDPDEPSSQTRKRKSGEGTMRPLSNQPKSDAATKQPSDGKPKGDGAAQQPLSNQPKYRQNIIEGEEAHMPEQEQANRAKADGAKK
jgi:histone deacetylase complex regulatory component SIN3